MYNKTELPNFVHLTDKYLGETVTLKPNLPREPFEDEFGNPIEDTSTPRVSFADSLDSALLALKGYAPYEVYYIYGTDKLNGRFVPKSLEDTDNAVDVIKRKGLLPKGFDQKEENLILAVGRDRYRKAFIGIVPDSDTTGEIWAKKPTKVKYIGKLIFNKIKR